MIFDSVIVSAAVSVLTPKQREIDRARKGTGSSPALKNHSVLLNGKLVRFYSRALAYLDGPLLI